MLQITNFVLPSNSPKSTNHVPIHTFRTGPWTSPSVLYHIWRTTKAQAQKPKQQKPTPSFPIPAQVDHTSVYQLTAETHLQSIGKLSLLQVLMRSIYHTCVRDTCWQTSVVVHDQSHAMSRKRRGEDRLTKAGIMPSPKNTVPIIGTIH